MQGTSRPAFFIAFLSLAAACSGSPTGSSLGTTLPPPAPLANDVKIVVGAQNKGTSAFDPNPKDVALAGAANGQVRWVNGDVSASGNYGGSTAVTHHIRSDDGTSFDTGDLDGNATATKTLPAGTYRYHCTIHPTMKGTLNIDP